MLCVADVQSGTEHRKMAASLLRIGRLGCVKVNTLRLEHRAAVTAAGLEPATCCSARLFKRGHSHIRPHWSDLLRGKIIHFFSDSMSLNQLSDCVS